jgi:hypothetical protein
MTDHSELKRLAEAFPADLDWDSNTEPFFNGPSGESLGGGSTGFYSVYGKPFRLEGEDYDYDGPTYFEACNADFAKFMVAARDGVLALIAENEALRKDKDRLDALESNFWGVRHTSTPIGDSGDYSQSIEIVGSWMDAPRERVIGEDYNENLRAAIDQAMKAPAYPPARPEYEFDEIPDFGGGSGNKARRRAESMGIDYDAAMRKDG